MKVEFSTGEIGFIDGNFGNSGKIKITKENNEEFSEIIQKKYKKPKKGETRETGSDTGSPVTVNLIFYKNVANSKKAIFQ